MRGLLCIAPDHFLNQRDQNAAAATGAKCGDDHNIIHLMNLLRSRNIGHGSAVGEWPEHSLTVAERPAQFTPAF